jgi:hypothetical protein
VNTKQNILDRFSIHQINTPKFLLLSLSFIAEKRQGAMQKLFIKKKRKEKSVEKKWIGV